MAGITTALATSYKSEILAGTHTSANTYKIALFRAQASLVGTYNAGTTNYSTMTGNSDEASGSGYSAGGATLSAPTIATLGNWAYMTFSDPSWSTATITARGALIYNSSQSNKAVGVIDFGADKSSTAGTFTVDLSNSSTVSASITFAATTLTRAAGDWVADGVQIGHTLITDDATNPGPYVVTGVTTTVVTCSAASMTSGGPRTVTVKGVVVAF